MDELFFGVKRKKSRSSPARKTRRSPRSVRRSPKRKTRMCNKKLSLPKLRKLAVEHGVNIFSEAKTAVSKRTGMPKKPKMVGCSTLMKRLNEAGLDNLYKVRQVHVMPDQQLFMEPTEPMESINPMHEDLHESGDLETVDPSMYDMPVSEFGRRYMSGARPKRSQKHVGVIEVKGRSHHVFKGKEGGLYYLKGKTGRKVYIDKERLRKRKSRFGSEEEEDEEEMEYGRRYMSGARPKKSQKHVGVIEVKGRSHHVFKGKEGGLYYLKGKTGRKVYIDKERLRKRK